MYFHFGKLTTALNSNREKHFLFKYIQIKRLPVFGWLQITTKQSISRWKLNKAVVNFPKGKHT
jgi:hypothetical protein